MPAEPDDQLAGIVLGGSEDYRPDDLARRRDGGDAVAGAGVTAFATLVLQAAGLRLPPAVCRRLADGAFEFVPVAADGDAANLISRRLDPQLVSVVGDVEEGRPYVRRVEGSSRSAWRASFTPPPGDDRPAVHQLGRDLDLLLFGVTVEDDRDVRRRRPPLGKERIPARASSPV